MSAEQKKKLGPPVIRVQDMTGGYGDHLVFKNISFDVFQGEIFVILGGSGCGKSTLLKHLIGLVHPKGGDILINEVNIAQGEESAIRQVMRDFGVLFQSSALFGSMTLAENVALPLREYTDLPEQVIEVLVKLKLALVNLSGYEEYLPADISGGMKKRAGLARAMALNPKILFFDEPSAGLDPITSAELDQLIINLNRSFGTTMVIVTHELPSIFTVADRVIMLDKKVKGIIATGHPKELRDRSTNEYVRDFFHRKPEEH